jgi:gamma-glutamyltranspeptidase / glutathione hydrolase
MTAPRNGVSASSAAAAEVGARILCRGGNAVDAAIATALASCVADPGNCGIGGYGGAMIVAAHNAVPVCVDFNMWLPADWPVKPFRRIYTNDHPEVTAIPNVVAGLALALERFGSMRWAELVEPAIALASSGVEANGTTHRAFKEIDGTDFEKQCFVREPMDDGGFCFRQPALAATLQDLARYGPQWFHDGPIGRAACAIMEEAGSPFTFDHWTDAPKAARVVPAAAFDLDGVLLFSAPLGTSGSPSLFATVTKGAALARSGDLETPSAVLAWARALAATWSYRFGTPLGNDFSNISAVEWIEHALCFHPAGPIPESSGHTCHLNTCDSDGTLVALTFTHGQYQFGGRWAVPDTGVIMNAGMHLLTAANPVFANGVLYAVTNMSPTISRSNDGSSLAIGCPGARRIPTTIGLVLARHLFRGMPLQEAISRGRFHAETSAAVSIETSRWDSAVVNALRLGFQKGEDDQPPGALTAIRREADGAISFGLDDRCSKGYFTVGDCRVSTQSS